MRRMRLPYMRKAAPAVLATARAQRWDPAEVLRLPITEEVTGRDAATRRLRRHSANFPTGKTLGSWLAEDSTIPEPTQNSLITLEWIGRGENLVIAGPLITSGTGKSHFTEGLAQAAIENDLRVSWFTLETLSAAIEKSKVDGSTARTVARICRADLIVIDLCRDRDYAEAVYVFRSFVGFRLCMALHSFRAGQPRERGGRVLPRGGGDAVRKYASEGGCPDRTGRGLPGMAGRARVHDPDRQKHAQGSGAGRAVAVEAGP
ncbi:ATP-binding protein [Streptomyces sp. SID12501]|uniref:ATP-binding protein n=1 Tax=Streptomyces sp. SID12501 TaxID=2706042 RepID=UPI001941EF5B|nr:ATP-binding protein [Streptomyces sp. SID12501]